MTLDEARDLHGERGTARDDVAVLDELPGGARKRAHVDAVVLIEALVLERHEHGEVALIDLLGCERQPPAALVGRERAQELVVAVEDGDRHLARLLQVRRAEVHDNRIERSGSRGERERCRAETDSEPAQGPLGVAPARGLTICPGGARLRPVVGEQL